ncbi:hypothetical protein D3C75_1240840 [compost metagenome]
MVDAEEEQRRHAHVEHQLRGDAVEVVVDQVNAFEQDAHEQHGENRCRDVQGLDKKGEHAQAILEGLPSGGQ